MKIVFVCGSPKGENSLSMRLIEQMIPFLKGHQYGVLQLSEDLNRHTALQIMDMADGIILVSPVYFGGLPSALLGFLSDMELHMQERRARVSAVVHGDLTDPEDTMNTLSIIERWSLKTGLSYKTGLGIGASDALSIKQEAFHNQHLQNGLQHCMEGVLQNQDYPSFMIMIGNRMAYRRLMENHYRKKMSDNGIEPDSLSWRLHDLFRTQR